MSKLFFEYGEWPTSVMGCIEMNSYHELHQDIKKKIARILVIEIWEEFWEISENSTNDLLIPEESSRLLMIHLN